MTLEQVVDNIEDIATSAPNINTFVFDDLETVNELHATNYPLMLLTPSEDSIDLRADTQDYNLEFFIMDLYFQDDTDSLRKKYSDLQSYGVQVIQEMYDVNGISNVDDITINRGQDQYNDNLIVVQFSFTVRVHDCMRLLKSPTNLTATVISSSQIDLTWYDRENTETSYEVYRSLDGNTWGSVATLSSDVTSYSDTGLDSSTTYYYRVRCLTATNRSAFSNVANETTSA